MTIRQIWEGLLVALNKINAPSILLEEFNYFINKAIYLLIDRNYALYDLTLYTTDYLNTLKKSTKLTPSNENGITEVILPPDYLHMLNCICVYKVSKKNCPEETVAYSAKRLTADSWSVIVNDYYSRPLPQRPYYYLHNSNTSTESDLSKTDSIPQTVQLNNAGIRCEIKYGNNSIFELLEVLIDYLKTPETIRLTQDLIDLTIDTSQKMEFPDFVCNKIIDELVMLVMERNQDPRLLTYLAVTLSVVSPVQQQASQN